MVFLDILIMKKIVHTSILLFLLGINYTSFSQNPSSYEDEEMVKRAILDYVEGIYEADTTRIYKSVHSNLVKRGTFYDIQIKDYSPVEEMNFQQLVNLTKKWNQDGSRANSKTVRDVTIYEVQDKTATAKVIAAWGTDYFHLAKIDENGT